MVYLYAGLGVAMLTGIMAIFEMGLALTGRSLLPSPLDLYSESIVKRKPSGAEVIVEADPPLAATGTSLCEQIFSAYSDAHDSNPWSMDRRMPVLGPFGFLPDESPFAPHCCRPNSMTGGSPY